MDLDNPAINDATATTQSQSDNSTKVATTAYVDAAAAARGDASGPGSSTDNAVARFDGTGGKTLQNSSVIIDDSDNVTGVTDLTCEGINHDYVIYEDQKSTGTRGGTSSSSTWHTRDLNTVEAEKDDSGSFSTLSSNQFTLQAGRYYIFAYAPVMSSSEHKVRLDNITDTTVESVGTSEFTASTSSIQTRASLMTEIDIGSAKAFEIIHYTAAGRASNGLGDDTNVSGYSEVYTQVYIKRLGP